MDKTTFVRGVILRHLQSSRAFDSVVSAEVKCGNCFSATDIALRDTLGRVAVYRLVLIKHG